MKKKPILSAILSSLLIGIVILQAETFTTWQSTRFTPAQLSTPAVSSAAANPDGDIFSNLQEYAFALEPFTANSTHEALGFSLATPTTDGLFYTYVQSKTATDLLYQIEYTDDLTNNLWNLLTNPQEPSTPLDLGQVWQRSILVPSHFPKREFLRLRLHQQTNMSQPIVLNDPPQQLLVKIHEPFVDADLAWIDRSNQESGYRIERHASNTSTWTHAGTTTYDTRSFRDQHLASDTLYYYRVRAVLYDGSFATASAEVTIRSPLDSDNDNLPDWFEVKIGTSSTNRDSDNDGLDDAFELLQGTRSYGYTDLGNGKPETTSQPIEDENGNPTGSYTPGAPGDPNFDPNNEDSDGNGTPDGEEDFDEDGLTNAEENLIGSEAWNPYSDSDTVIDGLDAIPTDGDIDYAKNSVPHYAIIELPANFNPMHTNSSGLVIGKDDDENSQLWVNNNLLSLPLRSFGEVNLAASGGELGEAFIDDQGKIICQQGFSTTPNTYGETEAISILGTYEYNGTSLVRSGAVFSSLPESQWQYHFAKGITPSGRAYGFSHGSQATYRETSSTAGGTPQSFARYFYGAPTFWDNLGQPVELKGLPDANDRTLDFNEPPFAIKIYNSKGLDDRVEIAGANTKGTLVGNSYEYTASDDLGQIENPSGSLYKRYGFLWADINAVPISLGENTYPTAVSDLNIAVGQSGLGTDFTPSLWLGKTGWKRKDLPLYEDKPEDIYKIPVAINSKGLILLDYTTLWANGFTYDLAELAGQPTGTLTATQLTESGIMLGKKSPAGNAPEKDVLIVPIDLAVDGVSEKNEETKGAFIPINANNNNGSTVTEGFAERIDLNVKPMAQDDPDLKEVKMTMKFRSTTVALNLAVTQQGTGGGRIKIWKDRRKTEEIQLPKQYTGENLPEKLYVEGCEESDAVRDITITFTALIGNQQIGTDKVNISVTPVLKNLKITSGRVVSMLDSLATVDADGSGAYHLPGIRFETELEVNNLSGSPRLIQNLTAHSGSAIYNNGSTKSLVLGNGTLPLLDCNSHPTNLADIFYPFDSASAEGTIFKLKSTDSPSMGFAPGDNSEISNVSAISNLIMYNVWEFEDHTLRVISKTSWHIVWHYYIDAVYSDPRFPNGLFTLKVGGDSEISVGASSKSHIKPAKLSGPAANDSNPHWE